MSASSKAGFLEIRIASTETRLITSAVGLCRSNSKFEQLQIAEAPMDVGDIGIYYSDSTTTTPSFTLLFLIERKTRADLHASFVDHRYQEQSLRLRTHPELKSPRQVLYLLECPLSDESMMSESDKIEWFRTQASLLMKPGHDFLVLQTKSTEESALAILSFSSKVLETIRAGQKHAHLYPEQGRPFFLGDSLSLGYTPVSEKYVEDKLIENTVLQTKKQGNLTPKMFFVTTIGCIPSIGAEIAKAVAVAFPEGLSALLQKAGEDPQSFVDLLASLKFGSTKRQSSIGKTRAAQILRYLCPHLKVAEQPEEGEQAEAQNETELQEGGRKKSRKNHEEASSSSSKKKWTTSSGATTMDINW